MRTLAIKQKQPMVTSYTAEQLRTHKDPDLNQYADDIAQLQRLALAGSTPDYEQLLKELEQAGVSCRSTKGVVYLTRQEDKEVEIEIKVQVKGHSLTWYFWAPGAMDQYPQKFRDELYNQAAICHREVDAGCDLYYRGSNSVHIKLMHTHESESGHNHNHYRLKDNKSYTPRDFRQHMQGFIGCEIEKKYFQEGEIERVCDEFEAHYLKWTHKVDRGMSAEELYFSHPSQLLNTGDIIELYLFGTMQEPCRLSENELKVDYQAARDAIEAQLKDTTDDALQAELQLKRLDVEKQYADLLEYRKRSGSRGLNSSIASSRQVEDSENPVIKTRQRMDDGLGVKDSGVPEWATKLKIAVEKSQRQMLVLASQRHKVRVEPAEDDAARDWAKEAGVETRLFVDKPRQSIATSDRSFFAQPKEERQPNEVAKQRKAEASEPDAIDENDNPNTQGPD